MTDPYMTYPMPGPQPPAPHRRKRIWPWIAAGVGVALVIALAFAAGLMAASGGSAEDSSDTTSVTSDDAVQPRAEDSADPEPEQEPFTVDDFDLRVKILSKECFGSAGCIVEYRVIPEVSAYEEQMDGRTVEVTYEIRGLEDGAQINTFVLEDGQYSEYELENSGQVSTARSKLTAKVTAVSE